MTPRPPEFIVEAHRPSEVPMHAVHDSVDADPFAGPIDLDTAADLDDLTDLPEDGDA